ncbi:hypothetical protein TVAG_008940 [Trichomonas vaginalis G3]|uniref:Uncharacterized protein n=1 Tax=Trichomonas vaginalis (strain ATCC PRA-98 / G3) TaxID=412133 RepID=A2FGT9_TRIV3|nr:hypothetical protein TVAGG3_0313650 [Trichomonas vaginalis G3]EAX95883.1 hypothetical protein TVAG_008940 [Trichomonas vaginalis G3]KAI5528790.1 hypothetical protein TVAGG3_0313650 [Trichomonas vaginalis G3]|eukprot:XP_001308813.1 hypothetical protein [Trichomonas vaginalis G3]
MLIGDVTVIPMKTALPVLEVFGSEYRVLMANRHRVRGTGKFFTTKNTAPLLSELKSVTLTDDRETDLVIVSSKYIDE